jgi:hypothetical protein
MMKLCKACGQEKPTSEFHKDKSKSDGLNAYCKPCQVQRQRAYQMQPPRRSPPPGMKWCGVCKQDKPITEFYSATGKTYDDLQRRCKPCSYEGHERWRQANLEKAARDQKRWRDENPEHVADHHLTKLYGIPAGTYQKMLAAQNGCCAICQKEPPKNGRTKRLHVDHCHDTGEIRGLLCHGCNVSIGHLNHDPKLLIAAAEYCGKPSAKSD